MIASLKQWLRGLGMSQFSPRMLFGYSISVLPDDWLRKRLVVPKLYLELFPYLAGADIIFNIHIAPTPMAKLCSSFNYEWRLYKKEYNEATRIGIGKNPNPSKVFIDKLSIGHFSYTGEYRLDLAVTIGGDTECQTVADFEISSRANFQLKFIWFVAGAILTIIAGFIGYLIGV